MHPLSYLSAKTTVGESPIHGRGLFANEQIAKDEIVAIKGGHIISRATLLQLQPTLGPAEIQIADDLYIGPVTREEREGSMIFSNHSCDPNIGVRGQITFVAMRAIDAGEELTHDWAMTDDDDTSTACHCGATDCRGTITGKDWQLPELQKRYASYFSSYLLEKMRILAAIILLSLVSASFVAGQEAVMDEVIVEAPFDVRLELPSESHVQILLDRLTLKLEMERTLELQIANRTPLDTLLNLTKYSPIPIGSSQGGVDTFMFQNYTRADLNPSQRNPLFEK